MSMNRPTLSIAPYYGGKGRMAHFICDRLDYDDSDIFVTPFGGMCRVLLNKPRHKVECYNDYSSGLNALMSVLSNPDKADNFIHRLYYETEYSQEEFDRQKKIFDNAEIDLEEQEKKKLRRLLIDKGIASTVSVKELLNDILLETNNIKRIPTWTVHRDVAKLQLELKSNTSFRDEFQPILNNWLQLHQLKESQGYLERSADMGEYVSEMDLAIATYVVFQQSMDGMGKTWSKSKFKSTDQYLNRVLKLYECAERLESVHIYQIDAIDFFRKYLFVDVVKQSSVDSHFKMLNEWINDPRVMMYCDPNYISPEDEAELLKGIDIYHEKSLSNAIKEKYDGKMPKNLGEIYAMSFGYPEQENFLRCIQNARCRIMVSNYDLELYNKYLNEETGWRREEFLTTTGVGSKVNNERVEVIWYNY